MSLLLKFVVLLKDIKEFDMRRYNRDKRKSLRRQTR